MSAGGKMTISKSLWSKGR